jgi:hypothetical protein
VIKTDVLVIACTLAALTGITAWQALKADEGASRNPMLPPMSSSSALPDGSKAVYLVLKELGRKPVRWGRSFAQLREAGGTLITYGAYSGGLQKNEIDRGEIAAIKEWTAKGNTVLAFGDAAVTVFGVSLQDAGFSKSGEGKGALAGQRFDGLSAHIINHDANDEVIIQTKSGPFALRRKVGDGTAYLFAGSEIVSNQGLGVARNAALLSLVPAGEKPVYIDDFHRGHIAGGSPLELLPGPVRTALWLCIAIGAIAILKQTVRFGPIEEAPPPERRSGAEIAWSLSRLLKQADAAGTAGNELIKAFRTEMGLQHDAPIEAALDRLSGGSANLRERARGIWPTVERGSLNTTQLIELGSVLAAIRVRIREETRGRIIFK